MNNKKVIFSGIQPSGDLHIGNYLGAILQWVPMQEKFESIFCVVDLHAITVPQNPEELNKRILEITKIYLAAGIDPAKATLFQQSDVSAHSELAWILNTVSRMSDLMKMTQFREKAGIDKYLKDGRRQIIKQKIDGEEVGREIKSAKEVSDDAFNRCGLGLFDYPVLMAADILLYNTDIVPVGEDQKQHVELARDLAKRFNSQFEEVFKVPEVSIRKAGARIMGLDEPTKKMSKSAKGEYNSIGLMDDAKKIEKTIMRAVTDDEAEVRFDIEAKPGVSNLLNIYSLLTDTDTKLLEKKYVGKGYGDFKKDLAKVVVEFIGDFQKKFNQISDDEVKMILEDGAKKLTPIANETLERVKKVMGLRR